MRSRTMWSRRRTRGATLVGVVVMGTLVGGCGTSLLSDESNGLLDVLANLGISDDQTIAEALNQFTVGDLAAGFVGFADEAALGLGRGIGPGLTDEQLGEIETLQSQLDAGEIDAASFGGAVREIIGDRGVGVPFAGFGFFGAPFGHRMDGGATHALGLTDEQRTAAEEIFQRTHDEIRALRSAAHDDIRTLLTGEQRAILDELFPGYGPDAAAESADGETSNLTALPFRGGSPGRGFGRFAPGRRGADQVADELQLTEAQQIAIDEIRTALRDAVRARHEQARDEFVALLTDEQRAQLGWGVDEATGEAGN